MPTEDENVTTSTANDSVVNKDDKNIIDKTLFFKNLYHLISKNNLRITKIEEDLGVSAGYISRTSKDVKTKLNLDFAYNIAKILKVNLDTIINVDLEKLSPNEEFILMFIEKLHKDTSDCVLNWEKITTTELRGINNNNYHEYPIISWSRRFFYEPDCSDSPIAPFSEHEGFGPRSQILTNNCYFSGDLYKLRMKNHVYLYVTSLREVIGDREAVELSMIEPDNRITYLSNSLDSFGKLSTITIDLYNNIAANFNRPRFEVTVRNTIEAFMKNDFKDDMPQSASSIPLPFDKELPF